MGIVVPMGHQFSNQGCKPFNITEESMWVIIDLEDTFNRFISQLPVYITHPGLGECLYVDAAGNTLAEGNYNGEGEWSYGRVWVA